MLLQVEGLRKSFGARTAVDGISFALDAGEIVGFLGPNGAGKTTTMRMVAGYLEPDDGFAKVFSIDVAQDRRRAQERVGYLPEGAPLYGEMTPWMFLRFTPCAARRRMRAWATPSPSPSRRCPRATDAASASLQPCCTIRCCSCSTSRPTGLIPISAAPCAR
jgi:ABC-type Mn2+/Zn2+ transport system ATPase subunit